MQLTVMWRRWVASVHRRPNQSGRVRELPGDRTMDVAILLIVTVCGAMDAPLQLVLLGALILTLMSLRRKIQIARTHPDVGSSRVLAGALFLSFVNNTVFTLLSFALGRVASQLV